MAEIIRALADAVDRIGLLAVLILVVIFAAAYVGYWNRQLVNEVSSLSKDTIKKNTISMDDLRASANLLTTSIDKLTASQETICRAGELREAERRASEHRR